MKTKKLHFNPEYNTVNTNNECARFVRGIIERLRHLEDMVDSGSISHEALELEITNMVRQASGSFEVL